MTIKTLLIFPFLAIQLASLTGAGNPKKQSPDFIPEIPQAKILKAEDCRDENQLKKLLISCDENQTGMITGLALAAGRIPSFEIWKSLAAKFGKNRDIAEALAIAVRFPDTRFPAGEVFRILRSFIQTKTVVETFLFLNSKEAFDHALSLDRYQQSIASNLWRSKDFVNEEILKKYYAKIPAATVYSIYRTRTKGIVKSSDIRGLALGNRFYGCLVCDHPEEFLTDPDWRVRIAAVRGANSADAAKPLLADPNPLVQAAALQIYLENKGLPGKIDVHRLNAMETEILCPYIKDMATIKRIYEGRGHFSEISAPFLGKPDKDRVLSSTLSDRAKLSYLEKQFGKRQALAYARMLFLKRDSSSGLQYLLEQEEKVQKEKMAEIAKNRGKFTSELQDYGFLKQEPLGQPLSAYAAQLKAVRRYRGFFISTEKGTIACAFYPQDAPLTCNNFINLVKKKYFDNCYFHRVIPAFVAQDGDPGGTGSGGPGYSIRCEYNRLKYDRPGLVGMARSGKDTGGSQFFITHLPTPHLDYHYTIFARVIKGLDVLSKICQYDRILKIRLF
jgi:cyclophilin family peptidyl-prolyl cis-trans isomerase